MMFSEPRAAVSFWKHIGFVCLFIISKFILKFCCCAFRNLLFVLPFNSGWLGTGFVDRAGLRFNKDSRIASEVVDLKDCTNVPIVFFFFFFLIVLETVYCCPFCCSIHTLIYMTCGVVIHRLRN